MSRVSTNPPSYIPDAAEAAPAEDDGEDDDPDEHEGDDVRLLDHPAGQVGGRAVGVRPEGQVPRGGGGVEVAAVLVAALELAVLALVLVQVLDHLVQVLVAGAALPGAAALEFFFFFSCVR